MPTIADWVFAFLDIACLTFCSAYLVILLPHDKKNGTKQDIAPHRKERGMDHFRIIDRDASKNLAE